MEATKQRSFSELFIEIAGLVIIPMVLLAILILLSTKLVIGEMVGNINKITDFWETMLCFSLPMLLALGVFPALYELILKKKNLSEIGLRYHASKKNNLVLIVNLLLLITSFIMLFHLNLGTVYTLSVILSFLVVALTEELMMRGIILNTLNERMPWILAALISSVLFAFVYHSADEDSVNLVWRFSLGFLFCIVTKCSGSIYQSAIMHFWVNIFVNILPAYLK